MESADVSRATLCHCSKGHRVGQSSLYEQKVQQCNEITVNYGRVFLTQFSSITLVVKNEKFTILSVALKVLH